MNSTVELVIYSLIGLIAVAVQGAVSYRYRPSWLEEDTYLDENWRKIANQAIAAGAVAVVVGLLISLAFGLRGQAAAFGGPIAFAVVQSFYTDLRVRYADRWILRVAMVSSLFAGSLVLALHGTELDWVIYLSAAAVAFALGLFPGVGQSDGRAFTILVLATYPTIGIMGLQTALVGMVIAIAAYYGISSAIKKEFTFKGLMTKVSFPMVPLILAPTLFVALFGKLLTL